MLTELSVSNYRSIKELFLPIGNVNVLLGPNGKNYFSLSASAILSHGNAGLPKWPFFAVGR